MGDERIQALSVFVFGGSSSMGGAGLGQSELVPTPHARVLGWSEARGGQRSRPVRAIWPVYAPVVVVVVVVSFVVSLFANK